MRISMDFLKRMFHRENRVAEATSVEQKEVSAETASAEKAEQNVKRTVQSGRSMVEMLGVLAVIGVLSVAGIAGYQFAMNKYRANQIANELNLVSNQIMFTLLKTHREDFELTLVSPFDEDTLPSGFPFTYGCGTDTTMTGCFADDTTYYETLSGLPEDLCKTVAQLTQNLSYLVEQRVNDTVDTMGTSCSGDNNEIVMLFAVDEDADIGLPDETEDSGGDFGDGSDGNNDSQGSDTSDDDTSSSGLFPEDWPFMPATYVNFDCESDDGCRAPYSICYHGLCIECLEDADCAESRWGNYCNRGTCSSSPVECVLNSDCADNEYCYNGNCYTAPNEICSDNSDCVD